MRAELARVLSRPEFQEASRSSELLTHIVEAALTERESELTGTAIAQDVFDRGSEFDSSTDSIVRVQASRLRSLLDRIYENEPEQVAVRILVPKGSYVPRFEFADEAQVPVPAPLRHRYWNLPTALTLLMVAVIAGGTVGLIQHYRDPTWDALETASVIDRTRVSVVMERSGSTGEEDALLRAFTNVLRASLASTSFMEVVSQGPVAGEIGYLDFGVRLDPVRSEAGERIKVAIVERRSDRIVWIRSLFVPWSANEGDRRTAMQAFARSVQVRLLALTQTTLARMPADALSANQLFLLSTWMPGSATSTLEWEEERIELARMALRKEPDMPAARSVLADKLVYLASVDRAHDTSEALREARAHARAALQAAQQNAFAVFNVGIHHWHLGNLERAEALFRRVVDLDPYHPLASILVELVPHTCRPAPVEVIERLIEFDSSLTPDDPIRWVTLTWIGILHLNRGEYAAGLAAQERASLIFQTPDTAMRHAVLAHAAEKPKRAREVLAAERERWPNLDPAFFAEVTIPRRCRTYADTNIAPYAELAAAMTGGREKGDG